MRLLSRSSDLARLQTRMVQRALAAQSPHLAIETLTSSSAGDRDRRVKLWQTTEKGLFTSDLSDLLLAGGAEIAVHSWKDLPVEGRQGTLVAGTLPRADPRDLLLMRRSAATARPTVVDILTSSPRRAFQLQASLAELLPWPVSAIRPIDIRGNIPTRLSSLLSSDAHGLIVAKAALDRLLSTDSDPDVRERLRRFLDEVLWAVLPLREFPTAPAQGALALEVAANRTDIQQLAEGVCHKQTQSAGVSERSILEAYGGGCHEAIGATVLVRDYGTVTSVRGRLPTGDTFARWSLESARRLPPGSSGSGSLWPRPNERGLAMRRPLPVVLPDDDRGWWVARADAVPASAEPPTDRIIWAAGSRTWRRLAARGFWVNGCADGLGDTEDPAIGVLAGRTVTWHRLTHAASRAPGAVATYEIEVPLPPDLGTRTHFFWTSGTLFREALRRYPAIGRAWHGCGPGRTARVVTEALADDSRVSIWLDYEQWHHHVTR